MGVSRTSMTRRLAAERARRRLARKRKAERAARATPWIHVPSTLVEAIEDEEAEREEKA